MRKVITGTLQESHACSQPPLNVHKGLTINRLGVQLKKLLEATPKEYLIRGSPKKNPFAKIGTAPPDDKWSTPMTCRALVCKQPHLST